MLAGGVSISDGGALSFWLYRFADHTAPILPESCRFKVALLSLETGYRWHYLPALRVVSHVTG